MMIDPLGNQQAGFVYRCFRMMDPVQRGAGLKRGHVVRPDLPQLPVRSQHGPFTPSANQAFLRHSSVAPVLRIVRIIE